jgi:hypothetical protein
MTSEWMKVMLEEVARKKGAAEQDKTEQERRRTERDTALTDLTPDRSDDPT